MRVAELGKDKKKKDSFVLYTLKTWVMIALHSFTSYCLQQYFLHYEPSFLLDPRTFIQSLHKFVKLVICYFPLLQCGWEGFTRNTEGRRNDLLKGGWCQWPANWGWCLNKKKYSLYEMYAVKWLLQICIMMG